MAAIPTVKVSDGQGGYCVINTTDFDRDRHILYEESPPYAAADAEAGEGEPGEDVVEPLPPEFAMVPEDRSLSIATRVQYLKAHHTVTALRQMAKAWEISGRSSMNEDELAIAIAEAESRASAEDAYAAAGRVGDGETVQN